MKFCILLCMILTKHFAELHVLDSSHWSLRQLYEYSPSLRRTHFHKQKQRQRTRRNATVVTEIRIVSAVPTGERSRESQRLFQSICSQLLFHLRNIILLNVSSTSGTFMSQGLIFINPLKKLLLSFSYKSHYSCPMFAEAVKQILVMWIAV